MNVCKIFYLIVHGYLTLYPYSLNTNPLDRGPPRGEGAKEYVDMMWHRVETIVGSVDVCV